MCKYCHMMCKGSPPVIFWTDLVYHCRLLYLFHVCRFDIRDNDQIVRYFTLCGQKITIPRNEKGFGACPAWYIVGELFKDSPRIILPFCIKINGNIGVTNTRWWNLDFISVTRASFTCVTKYTFRCRAMITPVGKPLPRTLLNFSTACASPPVAALPTVLILCYIPLINGLSNCTKTYKLTANVVERAAAGSLVPGSYSSPFPEP